MATIYLPLLHPSRLNVPGAITPTVDIIAEAEIDDSKWGENGAIISADSLSLKAFWVNTAAGWQNIPGNRESIEFNFLTPEQRRGAEEFWKLVVNRTGIFSGALAGVFPLIAVITHNGASHVYHHVDMGARGGVYVRYHYENGFAAAPDSTMALIERGRNVLEIARRSVNDACHHGRWEQDYEFERKFTFKTVPDTWKLIHHFYEDVLNGGLKGFFPEVGLEFQAFDYIVDMFEVTSPPEQQGYIAFIPQTNGKTIVKQKWFDRNKEMRREELKKNQLILRENQLSFATELSGGRVVKRPSYRRKRFDINVESLKTGNVYGIFLDICRSVDRPEQVFSQCELEYCRSRTFGPFREVNEEFELMSTYIQSRLRANNLDFNLDNYSKLDFVREIDAELEQTGAL